MNSVTGSSLQDPHKEMVEDQQPVHVQHEAAHLLA